MEKTAMMLEELVLDKVYSVKWKYKGNEFQDSMKFYGSKGKHYYFKDDEGDFLIATKSQIISVTQTFTP